MHPKINRIEFYIDGDLDVSILEVDVSAFPPITIGSEIRIRPQLDGKSSHNTIQCFTVLSFFVAYRTLVDGTSVQAMVVTLSHVGAVSGIAYW